MILKNTTGLIKIIKSLKNTTLNVTIKAIYKLVFYIPKSMELESILQSM